MTLCDYTIYTYCILITSSVRHHVRPISHFIVPTFAWMKSTCAYAYCYCNLRVKWNLSYLIS